MATFNSNRPTRHETITDDINHQYIAHIPALLYLSPLSCE